MTAKIIKLDQYISEYVNMQQPNITAGMMSAYDITEEQANIIQEKLSEKQWFELSGTFANDKLSVMEKTNSIRQMVDPILSVERNLQMEDLFNGISIAEDYNYRRSMTSEMARGSAMDWLEENGIDYLIDNSGNFAVKCNDRKTHYRVNRQFEHILGKWDAPKAGTNVDPAIRQKALTVDMKGNVLRDAINETGLNEAAQDGSMPLDMSGTPPMFPAVGDGDMTDGASPTFENTEDGAIQILGDYMNFSSEIYVERLEEEANEWLVCDDAVEKSFVVDTDKGCFEEIQYICEQNFSRGNTGNTQGFGTAGDSVHTKRGYMFDPSGRPVDPDGNPVDPVSNVSKEKSGKFTDISTDEFNAVKSEEDKINLMVKHGIIDTEKVPERYWSNFIATHYNETVPKILAIRAKGGNDGVKEANNKTKPKVAKTRNPYAPHLKRKGHMVEPDATNYKRNPKHKPNYKDVHEGVMGAATGMTGMQTLGMHKLRKMSGFPDASMTVIEIDPFEQPVKNEPLVTHGSEIHDMNDALDHLNEVFNIYKTLNGEAKTELRLNLINTIMDDGSKLSESVIGLLLNNKSSVLLEYNDDGEMLSVEDKEYLNMVLSDIKGSIMEDISISDNDVSVPLSRIAYLLEALQHQMEIE